MGLVWRRLVACWFGPIAGLLATAVIFTLPLPHWEGLGGGGYPYPSDPYMRLDPALVGTPGTVALLVLAILVVLALQLLSSKPLFLIAVGLGTTVLWAAALSLLVGDSAQLVSWTYSHGLLFVAGDIANKVVLLILPSGFLPFLAGIRGLRRGPTAPPR